MPVKNYSYTVLDISVRIQDFMNGLISFCESLTGNAS